MGFEIKYTYHPRGDDGYDTNKKEQKFVKVGKPFDETPLEKLAAAIMAQLARRDIWVVDVEVCEFVRKNISFKECKDGKGIVLKGKRFSFNEAAEMISEEEENEVEEPGTSNEQKPQTNLISQNNSQSMDDLYSNPNKPVPVQKSSQAQQVNQNKVIYKVLFDPSVQYINEVRRLGLRLTPDKEYPVHQVVQHPTGKLELQKIAVTDDTGKAVLVDEKFFTIVGTGLLADKQLNFSGSTGRSYKKPKLAFENELVMDMADPRSAKMSSRDIPLDDGNIPAELMAVPDIRANRR
jgi:hypothetical protein